MDVRQRNPNVRRSGYNPQTNESERCQVPGHPAGNTRNYISSQVPSSMQNQVLKNQVPTQMPGNTLNKVPSPFPNSLSPGHSTTGNFSLSAACFPQRNNVSLETHKCTQAKTMHSQQDRAATTLSSVYRETSPDCDKYRPQVGEAVFTGQNNRVEGAYGFRTSGEHQKVPVVRHAVGYKHLGLVEKASSSLNYINPQLVQKVLECQKKRAQTPTSHLHHSFKEVSVVGSSAGRKISHFKQPEHHSSDVSLSNKMADCRVTDPETVSTGSQKESGYQSGDSVGDRSSENSDLGRTVRWPTAPSVAHSCLAIPDTPDGQCEQYFLKGDSLMDLCSEQERSGNWQQALSFLNQAIDFFQRAVNTPGASHENLLRMRLKHNRAVLHRRKLMKQSGFSTESTNRRLPCPPQEAKGRLSTDVFSQHHLPISEFHNIDCDGNAMNGGYCMENSLYPDDRNGKFISASDGNGGNVSIAIGNPCLPETGPHWTSDDVKDIKIYATLPKNRSRKGPLVTDTPTINPVQNKLQSEISMFSQNQESRHPSAAVVRRKNTSEYMASDGRKCQQVPNCYGTSGLMHSREPEHETIPVEGKFFVPNRAQQMPFYEGQRTYDMLSRNFGTHNVDNRKTTVSTSDPVKLVRF